MVFGEERLSYGELDGGRTSWRGTCGGAGWGRRCGWGCAWSGRLELVVGLLGIVKAGGAYVPLDPEYPRERLAFMVEDSRVSGGADAGAAAGRAGGAGGARWCVWTGTGGGSRGRAGRRWRAGWAAENLAYVIYTSGSTGVPKGVEVTHRGGDAGWCSDTDYVQLSGRRTGLRRRRTPVRSTRRRWRSGGRCCTGARLVGLDAGRCR